MLFNFPWGVAHGMFSKRNSSTDLLVLGRQLYYTLLAPFDCKPMFVAISTSKHPIPYKWRSCSFCGPQSSPVRDTIWPGPTTQIAIILLLIDNNLNIFDDSHLPTSLLFIEPLSLCSRFTARCYLTRMCFTFMFLMSRH